MKLIKPCKTYAESYREAVRENQDYVAPMESFRDLPTDVLIETYRKLEKGIDLPAGFVPATNYWMVEGDRFLGQINFRHTLTPSLERFGGHIGYVVRHSEWNKGVGTEMLRQLLDILRKEAAIDRVLLTCNDENIGSARVIEKNGGVLQDVIENEIAGKKRLTRRYWITL